MEHVYRIARAAHPLPVIFDSAHSGAVYPADFKYACDFSDLEKAEDKYVDELFSGVTAHGGTLLCALFPRSYIDANRAVDDIDPHLLSRPWPEGTIHPTARSDAGIGLIRRLVRPGLPVYDRALPPEEVMQRITDYYEPYHAALAALLDEAYYNFGQVWHVNCHSMPSSSARPRQPGFQEHEKRTVDFVLGDRDGTTCDLSFTHAVRDFLKEIGYSVSLNDPFKGAELIERYAKPARQRHSLQIEINKSLYMDEETGEKSADFEKLKKDIDSLIAFCADFVRSRMTAIAAD